MPDKLLSLLITILLPKRPTLVGSQELLEIGAKVVVFFDPIDGGQCLGLAFSRNPMQTIDAAGNVVFWANLDSNGTSDRLVLGLTDGNLLIAARRAIPRRWRHFWVNGCLACDKRQHWHPQRRDAWRPKWRAQRAYGFQSLPKRDTYAEPDASTPTPSPTTSATPTVIPIVTPRPTPTPRLRPTPPPRP